MYKKFNAKFHKDVYTIFPGEYYIARNGEVICTVLGSCISVCLIDNVNKISGMNHFMLPINTRENVKIDSLLHEAKNFYTRELRYGTYSMEMLIGEMMKAGAMRKYFNAKLFGGGNVLNISSESISIGEKNIKFIEAYLELEKIPVIAKDLGRDYGRKIFFKTENNKVLLKRLASGAVQDVRSEEKEYNKEIIIQDKKSGEVDLF